MAEARIEANAVDRHIGTEIEYDDIEERTPFADARCFVGILRKGAELGGYGIGVEHELVEGGVVAGEETIVRRIPTSIGYADLPSGEIQRDFVRRGA